MAEGPPRKRARQACTSCNSRKVKCDVTVTGIPCSNCQRDATVTCETVRRRINRPRKSSAVTHDPSEHTHSLIPAPSTSATDPDQNGLPDDNALSYIGDRHGPRNYVYEICLPATPQDARRNTEQKARRWSAHQLEFLRAEGAFSPLLESVSHALVQCYFEHMHFLFPVLDVGTFFREAMREDEERCWLLYWAVMLAGANFIDNGHLQEANFSSRKELKRAIYTKAKCLYDLDQGSDTLVLIQALTLLSFWYTDAQDHTGAWYWIGCAISLAQTLGLHRAIQSQAHHSGRNEPLARRIWWTLVIRDRWLSLAKGRPMRISEDDCDLALPSPTDIVDEVYILPPAIVSRFLPASFDTLAGMWISLVQTSVLLGRILKAHYGIKERDQGSALVDIAKHRQELVACAPASYDGGSRSVELHACHMELFYQMAVIVLYRPYVLESKLDPISTSDAWTRARSAASSMAGTIERVIRLDGIDVLKPMAITALVPAMQIHLFDCRSNNPAMRALGQNKLELYLYLLAQLQRTYWSASVIHRLFSRALSIVSQKPAEGPAYTPPQENVQAQFDVDQLFTMNFDLFNVGWNYSANTNANESTEFPFW